MHAVSAYHSPPAENNWNHFSQLQQQTAFCCWKVSTKIVKTISVPSLLVATLGFLTHHLTDENLDGRRIRITLFKRCKETTGFNYRTLWEAS